MAFRFLFSFHAIGTSMRFPLAFPWVCTVALVSICWVRFLTPWTWRVDHTVGVPTG